MLSSNFRHLRRDSPLVLPTASGISSVVTASSVSITDSTLVYDHDFGTTATSIDVPSTTTPAPSSTGISDSSAEGAEPTTVAASSSTKPIAMSTVIATCVGSFIVVTAVIFFSICVYRRYSRSLNKFAKPRGHLHRRNVQSSQEQRRSHVGIWNRLEDDNDDKWEKSYHTREAKDSAPADVTPMEKLTMFKKSPSVRTAYTHKSTDPSNFSFPSTYAEFDPSLAASLKTTKPILKHTDSGLVSWSEANSTTHLASSVSLSHNMAIPTPSPTLSQTQAHKWEAAEVVHYSEGQSAEVVNPFEEDEREGGKTIHNPFFSAKDYAPPRSRRSNSTSTARSNSRSRSRANSTATQATVRTLKGKERARNSNATITPSTVNPFDDINSTADLPPPLFITHGASSSTSSMDQEDKERALKSLVAALELSEDEVRDRLRIASLQASIISATSSITVSEDVTNEFPLPPSTPTTAFTTLSGGSNLGR